MAFILNDEVTFNHNKRWVSLDFVKRDVCKNENAAATGPISIKLR